jgi:hypothetical protein
MAKNFNGESGKGVFLYLHVFLCGNEFLGPNTEREPENTVPVL